MVLIGAFRYLADREGHVFGEVMVTERLLVDVELTVRNVEERTENGNPA